MAVKKANDLRLPQDVTGANVALTMSVGTASDTIPDVGVAFNQTTLNNIVRSLGTKINQIQEAVGLKD